MYVFVAFNRVQNEHALIYCFYLFQEFHKIYRQFFPYGDPKKFSSFVFSVFDQNKVSKVDQMNEP